MQNDYEIDHQLVENTRRNEYMYQSDPLFFQWQRTEDPADKQTWLDKVQEIKDRNPYPEQPEP